MPWVPSLTVRVLTHERARADNRPVAEALVALVQQQKLAGITVMRAVEGVSDHGRLLRGSGVLEPGSALPLVVEMVDRTERIEALLPTIAALATSGTLTVSPSRLYFPASRLLVTDVMQPAQYVVHPDTPLSTALSLLLDDGVRLVPVVSADGILHGVLTLGQLLQRADPALSSHFAELRTASQVRHHLESLVAGHAAGEWMLTPPSMLRADTSLDAAARYVTAHHVTRVPVVDAAGRLKGVLTERRIVATFLAQRPELPDDEPPAVDLWLCVLPGAGDLVTAGTLADRDVPLIPETAALDEVVKQLYDSPTCLLFVVAADGHLRGLVDEAALLQHTLPGVGPDAGAGVRASVFRFVAHSPDRLLAALRQSSSQSTSRQLTAALVMRPAAPLVPAEMPVAEALGRMLEAGQSDIAVVVTPDGQPYGILRRQMALRILVSA